MHWVTLNLGDRSACQVEPQSLLGGDEQRRNIVPSYIYRRDLAFTDAQTAGAGDRSRWIDKAQCSRLCISWWIVSPPLHPYFGPL